MNWFFGATLSVPYHPAISITKQTKKENTLRVIWFYKVATLSILYTRSKTTLLTFFWCFYVFFYCFSANSMITLTVDVDVQHSNFKYSNNRNGPNVYGKMEILKCLECRSLNGFLLISRKFKTARFSDRQSKKWTEIRIHRLAGRFPNLTRTNFRLWVPHDCRNQWPDIPSISRIEFQLTNSSKNTTTYTSTFSDDWRFIGR